MSTFGTAAPLIAPLASLWPASVLVIAWCLRCAGGAGWVGVVVTPAVVFLHMAAGHAIGPAAVGLAAWSLFARNAPSCGRAYLGVSVILALLGEANLWGWLRSVRLGFTDPLIGLVPSLGVLGLADSCVLLLLPVVDRLYGIHRVSRRRFMLRLVTAALPLPCNLLLIGLVRLDVQIYQFQALAAWCVALIAAMLSIVAAGPFGPTRAEAEVAKPVASRVARLSSALSIFLLCGWCFSWDTCSESDSPGVTFVSEGGLDWERPKYGEFGSYSWGMFGLLPVYLERSGIQCRFTGRTDGVLDWKEIEQSDILVIINDPHEWGAEENAEARSYLEGGGTILVLADHTDVFGLMRGFNTLLPSFGMELRFDSAYPALPDWRMCSRNNRLANAIWPRGPGDLAYSIGASIACDPGTEILVSGPYALSDRGIRENQMGSYLGNYSDDPGELMGDLALVAQRGVGNGRVVVFGDTTVFQNGAVATSFQRGAGPVFRYLLSGSGRARGRFGWITIELLIACAIAAAWWACMHPGGVSLAVAAATGITVGGFGEFSRWPVSEIVPGAIVLDEGVAPRIGHFSVRMNVVSPLFGAALRSGMLTARGASQDDAVLQQARAIGVIAPQHFDPERAQLYRRHVEAGGLLVLAAGVDHARVANGYLAEFGLRVTSELLGRVPSSRAEERRDLPRFYAAAAVAFEGRDGIKILASAGTLPVALLKRQGRGAVLLIGDSEFFSSQNMDGRWGHWPGNYALVDSVLGGFVEPDHREVVDVYPSPQKPR